MLSGGRWMYTNATQKGWGLYIIIAEPVNDFFLFPKMIYRIIAEGFFTVVANFSFSIDCWYEKKIFHLAN